MQCVACVDTSIFLLDNGYQRSTGQWKKVRREALFRLDSARKTWEQKQTLPTGDYTDTRMASVQGQLLVAGGNKGTVAQYNPETGTWCTGNPPAFLHSNGALVVHQQRVFLMGGFTEDHVEEYNLETKCWSVCDVRVPKGLTNIYAMALTF